MTLADDLREAADQLEAFADDTGSLTLERHLLVMVKKLRAHAESLKPVGWQPISTAPKDRQILFAVQFDHENDWRMKTGWWNDQIDEWHVLGASWTPTLWHPMPDIPTLPGAHP